MSAELSSLTTSGGLYLGLRYGLGVLVSLCNMLVLTRWIGPHAYGLFVTALGLSGFLAALTRGGIDTYLVRAEPAPDKRSYDIATTLVIGLSMLLMICGCAGIPLLTRWYGSREFVPAYLATLLAVPLSGLAGPATAKLERELKFRAVAGIELGGQVLALIVSVVLAWRKCGLWAPVVGLLTWQLWASLGALRAARLIPKLSFERDEARRMLAFGLGYSSSVRTWQLRTLVNPLIVGRFAGAEGVAFVALAIRFAESLGFVRSAAGRLAIATLSRLQTDRERFRSVLEKALTFQVLSLGPLLCTFALVAPVVLPPMLGARWAPSLKIYPFAAAGVLINSVYNLQASALYVSGQQWTVLRGYALHVGLLAIVSAALLPVVGIVGYGWAEIAACGAYAILHVAGQRVARISYDQLGWLTFVFLVPLFSPVAQGRWKIALWIPLCASLVAAAAKWVLRRRQPDPFSTLSSRLLPFNLARSPYFHSNR